MRIAAVVAVVAAVVVVAVLLFAGGGGGYEVKARFLNASQLVKGNPVQIGGVKAGSVKKIDITPDGQAVITFSVDDQFQPLRVGTRAIIRQSSLSGIANRYIDLQLPPTPKNGKADKIGEGSTIPATETTTAVDLDQLFNVFDPQTRQSVKDLFVNSHEQLKGKTQQQRQAFLYLNPALSTSSRLFNEINADTPTLERFIVDSSDLVTTLAERRDDLAALIGNLNGTFRALGSQRTALAQAIHAFPDFMRQANTTFVDLRFALDEVDPLVNASKPAVRELRPFLADLRPFARDARPTVRDLSAIVHRGGANNDLYDLMQSFPALTSAALDTKNRSYNAGGGARSVGRTRGAFPEIAQATTDTAPIVAFGRPYTPDLFGWFDDFSNTGGYDALGGFSRVQTIFNAFSNIEGQVPALVPLDQRGELFGGSARTGQYKRCPGASEEPAADGSNVFTPAEQQALDCREADRAVGDVTK
ncbi:MAG: phospholipid/cholesterol/gamma-HCH transport system substrate-binding protein [Thermoleophilaceae bacterium]|nr:phospholipid/cholesterol/gamma-HCH transport system substrate-binding protein [Thermoleophilaceae bacterium]